MNEQRYRLSAIVRGETVTREVMLASEMPARDILNWLDDEYEFHAKLKAVYWLRTDGVEEQIYQQ